MKKKALFVLLGCVLPSCFSAHSFACCANKDNVGIEQNTSKSSQLKTKDKSFVASSGSADVKIQGSLDFKVGYVKGDHKVAKARYVSPNVKDYAFDSSAHINLVAEYKTDDYEDNITYGANIGVAVTSANDRSGPSYIYIKSDKFGKLELGSGKSANVQMKVDGKSVAVGAGISFDSWGKDDPRETNLYYVSNMGSYIDNKSRNSPKVEYARKISYFTPKIAGIQVGLSFIPDTSNSGAEKFSKADDHDILGKLIGYKFSIKNGVSYMVSYENDMSDDVKIKLTAGGENGSPVAKFTKKQEDPKYTFNKLAAYSFGAKVSIGDLGLAAGYQDQGKSLAPKNAQQFSGSSSMYSVGAGYTYGALRTSLFYFSSYVFKNKMNATALDVDYKLMPGILPYAEIAQFNTNGEHFVGNSVKNKDKTSGMVYLVGVKVEI